MQHDLHDCYRILDLKPGATLEEVKRSYRELVKVWHPDRFGNDPSLQHKAQEKLKEINYAYDRICKSVVGEPQYKTKPAQSRSTGAEHQTKPPSSEEPKRHSSDQSQSPRPDPNQATSSHGKEATWTSAAIGFSFLALSLWLVPTIWNDFSKYEAGEGIRTTRKMFLLYQVLGKQGVAASFILFGLSMGYIGLCHARALLAGQRQISFALKKGHIIVACVIIGLVAIISERPERAIAGKLPVETQPIPNYPAQVPISAQIQPEIRKVLTFEQILNLYQDALKKRDPKLNMSVKEFSQYWQETQTEYDFSAGIAYSPKPESAKVTEKQSTSNRPPHPNSVAFNSDVTRDGTVPQRDKKIELSVARPSESTMPDLNSTSEKFFTVGSTKHDVLAIQGKPTRFLDVSFQYGSSMVFFEDEYVSYWFQGSVKLKARHLITTNLIAKGYFTVGSTREEVLVIHGEPTQFSDNFFQYGSSMVGFDFKGHVSDWTQGNVKLKARYLTATNLTAKEYFTIGSTKEDVLAIHGEPCPPCTRQPTPVCAKVTPSASILLFDIF